MGFFGVNKTNKKRKNAVNSNKQEATSTKQYFAKTIEDPRNDLQNAFTIEDLSSDESGGEDDANIRNSKNKNGRNLKLDLAMETINLNEDDYETEEDSLNKDNNNYTAKTCNGNEMKRSRVPKQEMMGGTIYKNQILARRCCLCCFRSCYVLVPLLIILILLAIFGPRSVQFEVKDAHLKEFAYSGQTGKLKGDMDLTLELYNPNFFDVFVDSSDFKVYYPNNNQIGYVSFPGSHLLKRKHVSEVLDFKFEEDSVKAIYQVLTDVRTRESDFEIVGKIVGNAHVGIVKYYIEVEVDCLMRYNWQTQKMTKICNNKEHVVPSIALTYTEEERGNGGKGEYGDELVEVTSENENTIISSNDNDNNSNIVNDSNGNSVNETTDDKSSNTDDSKNSEEIFDFLLEDNGTAEEFVQHILSDKSRGSKWKHINDGKSRRKMSVFFP